jgi:hypothetical protein
VLQIRTVEYIGIQENGHASSNVIPCVAALAFAFSGSHSNTHSVYTEYNGMLSATDQEAVAHATDDISKTEEGAEADSCAA